ncbi:GNAT family N-acetyltransferase [Ralstonia mannitolilytica]|uniref:GNAT family N-acetyltransferase n=1 Tax=Ralstonia TaxID=48736 RepID=UPI000A67FED5|nr:MULTISPECIES: GNAT family N-acetyltransferase [Ralstonia]MBU9579671.1 GNAT family N-acetyltransferase [Ralstonia mannitolilytica]PLT17150.1 GNAT family N-acetyltransferase [Ralstonia mannitolilytica]
MLLRDATEADLPAILAIYNDVITNSNAVYTETLSTLEDRRAWLALRATQGYPVLVADDDGRVAGFASFGDFRPYPGFRTTVEHSVHIHRDWRGKGFGRVLVEALCERAAALGKHVMVGAIDGANAASIRLHEKLGFKEVGRMPEAAIKRGQWLDLVFMQRVLQAPGPAGNG